MYSNFIHTQNDTDIDYDIETEWKARYSTSVSELGEVDELREDATEHRDTSSYTTWSGRRLIKPSQYEE